MKRILAVLMAAVSLLGLAAVSEARPRTRTQSSEYTFSPSPESGVSGWFGEDYGIFFGDPVVFRTRRAEKHASIIVDDASSDDVSAAVWQQDGAQILICGSGEVPIEGGKPLFVQLIIELTPAMFEGCATPSVPSEGTITVTLSSRHRAHHH
ncbi:MAG: hypothetical protein ACRDLB_09245 [Actinomycetota bacterium]